MLRKGYGWQKTDWCICVRHNGFLGLLWCFDGGWRFSRARSEAGLGARSLSFAVISVIKHNPCTELKSVCLPIPSNM